MSENEISVLLKHFDALFNAHTNDEMSRYGLILDEVKKAQASSDRRHKETTSKIDNIGKQINCKQPSQELISAIPNGDMAGHHEYHDRRITDAKERRELHSYIKKVVLTSATMAVGSWVMLLLWQAFLQGPVK